jgi:hypothetical protein
VELDVVAVRPVPAGTTAVPAFRSGDAPPAAKRRQVAERRVGDHDDVAAAATVATVRPAFRHELLAPERERAVTAAAAGDVEVCAVAERR